MRRRSALIYLAAGTPALYAPLARAVHSPVRPAPIPPGYLAVGQRHGVPPLLLYGIALQESALLFGACTLPWPWTLNVQKAPQRYPSYASAVAALRACLGAGVRNVDTGLMQVNWGYHSDKLRAPEHALDPYPNMAVGASILREHFEAAGSWFGAVGRYHSPGNALRAQAYASAVYRRIALVPTPSVQERSSRG